ncbi:MAG: hypothetical protein DCF16_11635 [Alphaproteobacteria bacterium]|nr:MAG: hypothetical protein DCF16_11635 [Alphaproteobacteria bacterium]
MHIEFSTDRNIDGKERLADHVKGVVKHALSRFTDKITRVEVHVGEEISKKADSSGDKRCMMEARLEGRKPIAVSDHASTLDQAVKGAAKKLATSIETQLGRLNDTH